MSSRKIKDVKDADTEGRGRSFQRRAAKIYDQLALELVDLPDYRVAAMPVDSSIRDATREVQSTPAKVARRRSLRFLAGLLRGLEEAEEERLRRFLEGKSYSVESEGIGENSEVDLAGLRDQLAEAASYQQALVHAQEVLPDLDLAAVETLCRQLHDLAEREEVDEAQEAKSRQKLFRELRRAYELGKPIE